MNILILTGWGYHDYAVAAAATLKIFGNKADVCGVSRRRLPELLGEAGSKWDKIVILGVSLLADVPILAKSLENLKKNFIALEGGNAPDEDDLKTKDIQINTVGGVLQPGGKLMEIVPLEDQLLVETRINPRDIAYIRPGLPATVKVTAYDSSIYGDLKGTVEVVSPDTLQDEVRRDQFYYRVYVRTASAELKNRSGKRFPILPGMIANVEIKTGQKSVMDYLIKPLNKLNEALRER